MQVAMEQAQMINYEIELATEKEMIAKAPDKLKIPSSWKVLAEALETYLGQLLDFGSHCFEICHLQTSCSYSKCSVYD